GAGGRDPVSPRRVGIDPRRPDHPQRRQPGDALRDRAGGEESDDPGGRADRGGSRLHRLRAPRRAGAARGRGGGRSRGGAADAARSRLRRRAPRPLAGDAAARPGGALVRPPARGRHGRLPAAPARGRGATDGGPRRARLPRRRPAALPGHRRLALVSGRRPPRLPQPGGRSLRLRPADRRRTRPAGHL
ncbi:MAG: hypothetical protein AVDCRST_MAG19-1834, partial [uncultured Thermomicrobiales bacterium]